jgi:AcrR family transcriptional regulator
MFGAVSFFSVAEAVPDLGLRERKKQRTRQHIADTAQRLFAERGFENVTVGEVAREADVAQATVFNYFPAKEDLFYSRLEHFEERLLKAIRERRPGQSVLAAFAEFLLGQHGVLTMEAPSDEDATTRIQTVTRVITDSPALLARERQVFDHYARSLAALLAADIQVDRGDVVCHVVANALVGLHRALIDHVREQALTGAPVSRIRRTVRTEAERGIAQLEQGLRDFGVREPPS